MRHATSPLPPRREALGRTSLVASLLSVAMAFAGPSHAAVTELTTVPLQTATPTAKPNLMFILDDSGSMGWDFMPDWADTSTDSLARNSGFNATYYNPAIQYEPPVRPDGSRYPSMTAATTNSWRNVPFDGFGVQTARDTGNVLFTSSNSGTTQNLVNQAYYYVFIPGEFCADPGLRNCVVASGAPPTHIFPAMLRWCSDAALRNCRATRIDSAPAGVPTYTRARVPGMNADVPGSNMRVNIVASRNSYAYPNTGNKASSRGDCAGGTCTYAEEMTNFANWWAYYRTRMQMAKSAASIAFADVDEKFRIGYMSLNNNTGGDFLNVRDVDTDPNGQKFQWFSKLLAAEPGSSTPLRKALSTAGRYYANKLNRINGVNTTDPMQYACQRNFTMLSTDGYWNDSGTPTGVQDGAGIGDVDGANGVPRPYYDGTRTASTLADIAQYFYATDLRAPTFGNTNGAQGRDVGTNDPDDYPQQRMHTYTIGLGASGYMQYQSNYDTAGAGDYADVAAGVAAGNGRCGWQNAGTCSWPKVVSNEQTTIDDLWHAAVNGRGRYYSAASPVELRNGLQAFLADVSKSNATKVTAAAPSTLNLTATNNLAFGTEYRSGAWYGDVYAYQLDHQSGKATRYFLWSQSESLESGPQAKTSPKLASMSASDRKIYTVEFANSVAPKRIDFKWSESSDNSMSDDTKRHFRASAINRLSQFCASGPSCVPGTARFDANAAGRGTGIGGINLVNFLRGDRANEGQDNLSYYRKREHILGDIADAQPVYVKTPLFNYGDTGYGAFKTAQANRQAMVYVGANDGMLHAFHADGGPRGGTEAWAYIPSMLLPDLYKLADKDYANRHTYYVNATPRHGDIFVNGTWRTILVGGLGRGGRGYYALDITNAPNPPTVLWEFSNETSRGTGHSGDSDLGYTYGTPAIAKLSDGTWVVIVASGYNNVTPGSGRGVVWILDAFSGRVLHKIDTPAQAGCGTPTCPTGLAHIKVFADNGDRNNLATRVYGGDLQGDVWRMDISGLSATGGRATVTKLTTLTAPKGGRQPVTSAPELGKVNGIAVVFIGTGRYLGLSDLDTTDTQSIYAIKDTLSAVDAQQGSLHPSPRTVTCAPAGGKDCFVQQVITDDKGNKVRYARSTLNEGINVDFRTMRGWFIDFPNAGERMVYEPELQRGILAFTTSEPGSAEACKRRGTSYVNYVDYATGLTLAGVDNIGYSMDGGPNGGVTLLGLADGSTAILGGGGKSSETPDPPAPPVIPPRAGEGMRRISWRELVTDR